MGDRLRAFVVMPFDSEFSPIYADLICPALEEQGYDVRRADSFLDQRNILQDIVEGIDTADLVIADLTTVNANVMYELGVSHALDVPTILIAQSIEDIPFDLRSYKVLEYSTRFDHAHKLKATLSDVAERHAQNAISFGNPVTDFRGVCRTRARRDEGGQAKEEASEEVDDGFLDYMLEAEGKSGCLGEILTAVAEETGAFGNKLNEHTAEIARVSERPGPGTAGLLYRVASSTADDIRSYADRVKALTAEYDELTAWLVEAMGGYATCMDNTGHADELKNFVQDVRELYSNSTSALVSTKEYRDAVSSLRGISKPLNSASRHLTEALNDFISTTENLTAFCARLIKLHDSGAGTEDAGE